MDNTIPVVRLGLRVRLRSIVLCTALIVALCGTTRCVAVADEPVVGPTPADTSAHAAAVPGPEYLEGPSDSSWLAPYGAYCDDCNRLRYPTSYAWVEGLVLTRENDAANRPLVLDVNTNDTLLTAGDLDFDWSGGMRVGYACREYDCWGLEFGYLSVFDQQASASVFSDDDLRLPGALGLAVNNFFQADEVHVHYISELQSGEITMVYSCVGCEQSLEWLAGFRYIYFGEGIGIRAVDSAESTTRYNVGTDNNLIGAQIGARGYRRVSRFAIEGTAKAGLYGNYMEQSQRPIIDFPDFNFRSARSSDGGDVAFVGDLNLTGIYQVTRVFALRAGYNALWLEGVALAPDQLDFSNGSNSGRELVEGGGVLLHGVNAGFEARW